MPDALSKTVPIWCAVWNSVLFPEAGPHGVHTPPKVVGESEREQINEKVKGWVQEVIVRVMISPQENRAKSLTATLGTGPRFGGPTKEDKEADEAVVGYPGYGFARRGSRGGL
jgi:hypothetical protein